MIDRPLYEKMFARDYCLPFIEMWCKGESTDPRQYTTEEQPKVPYIVFERTPQTVNCYMDPAGIVWIKEELARQVKKNPEYVRWVVDTYYKKLESIRPLWGRNKPLTHDELVKFMRDIQEADPWFEGVWWLLDSLPAGTDGFRLVEKARGTTDLLGPGSDALLRLSLKSLYPHLGELSIYLLVEEIAENMIPSREELELRQRGYWYTYATLFPGVTREDIEGWFNIQIERVEATPTQEIRGQVAYQGKVRGNVRLIMGVSAVSQLQRGEILVSPMTMPDFAPAMRKAAAFVTDEGGITCHAAIMAREFKKPCVIGTKVATQVLKDGDEVEVDAEKGIVRILKRA